MFKRESAPKADPAEVVQWRGRSEELDDGGSQPWEVVLESLKTSPEPEVTDEMEIQDIVMAPLGLVFDEDYSRGTPNESLQGTAIFHGVRHGRPVLINQGSQRSGGKGALVVWVRASTPQLSLVPDNGTLRAEGDAPPAVTTFLAGLAPQPKLWKDVHIVGGAEGIVVKRPIKTFTPPQGWIYDIWLAERVCDLVGAHALPEPDWQSTYLPHHLDRAHTW